MRKLRSVLIVLGLVLAFGVPGMFAQGFQIGSIAGVITDATGGALPGVSLTVTSAQLNVSRTVTTDASGRYRFSSLPLGTYSLEAVLDGFQTAKRQKVLVEAEKTTLLDVSLALAAAVESITVTADAPIVDPTNVTQTTSVTAGGRGGAGSCCTSTTSTRRRRF